MLAALCRGCETLLAPWLTGLGNGLTTLCISRPCRLAALLYDRLAARLGLVALLPPVCQVRGIPGISTGDAVAALFRPRSQGPGSLLLSPGLEIVRPVAE